jgi:tRNA (adenine57-N1/adenine58-N1)-methyltransferase
MPTPTTAEATRNRAPLAAGDIVILYDRQRRRYRVTLREGSSFSTHLGGVPHSQMIGRTEGFTVFTTKSHPLVVIRPTFREAVLELPRQSQVIYPKDLGTILMRLDLYPGAHVAETGLGSGAASAAILRAIGNEGSLVTYEIREHTLEGARANIAALAPDATNHRIVVADAYENGFADHDLDRILLDLGEPELMASHAADALRPGGIVCAFMPTVLQVHRFTMALTQDPRWRLSETIEIMERTWHVSDASVRPDHRMVGHSGFITTARRAEPARQDAPIDSPPEESSEGYGESDDLERLPDND